MKKAIGILALILVTIWVFLPMYVRKMNITLYLFGNFIAEDIFHNSLYLIGALICLPIIITDFKSYKIAKKIIYPVAMCFLISLSVYDIAETVNGFSAKEEINLPDGNKIVLYEDNTSFAVMSNPITAVAVYNVKGIIAKRIGFLGEGIYCSDYCLKEDKWDYTYNKSDKKLTLIVRYNEPKDEDDTGVLEKEFTL